MKNHNSELEAVTSKINLLLKLNTDFEHYAHTQIKDLIEFLEKHEAKYSTDDTAKLALEHIKQILQQHLNEIIQETQDSLKSLENYRSMAASLVKLSEDPRKKELIELFLQEAGKKESLESFQKRTLKQEIDRRKTFKNFIDEIRDTISEGGIIELEAFLEDQLLKESQKQFGFPNSENHENSYKEKNEENNESNEYDSENIKNFFEKMKNPYWIDTDNETVTQSRAKTDEKKEANG